MEVGKVIHAGRIIPASGGNGKGDWMFSREGDKMHNGEFSTINDLYLMDFVQLKNVIKDIRSNHFPIKTEYGTLNAQQFEVPPELVTALETLDDLLTKLYKNTLNLVNSKQQKFLLSGERTVAYFYRFISIFITSIPEKTLVNSTNLNDDFYFLLNHELRSSYLSLKLFTEAPISGSKSSSMRNYWDQIYVSPFVPENQKTVTQIGYWTKKLGKFMDGLP